MRRERVAQQPPRSTLWFPNQGAEYSLYGPAIKPGYGLKSLAVHSHTLPIICRHPNALSPAGRTLTGMHPITLQSRFARSGVGASLPQGNARLSVEMLRPPAAASALAAIS